MATRTTATIISNFLLLWVAASSAPSSVISANISFSSLGLCPDSSFNISKYGQYDALDPCIIYDIRDSEFDGLKTNPESLTNDPSISKVTEATITNGSNSSDKGNPETSEVALVQITPSLCNNHRDGATIAVKNMNAENGGKGMAIGYNLDHFVKFRLISIIGGNNKNTSDDHYTEVHQAILDSVLESVDNAQFIIGSCSFASAADKPIALKRKKIVISQVGPPGFYRDVEKNPYVFGIHVNSDTYPLPALRALQFSLNAIGTPTSQQAVNVLYRDKSEFFYSTCRSVIDEAMKNGFDVNAIEYDPEAYQDNSDVKNSQNTVFMESLGDLLCPFENDTRADSMVDGDTSLPKRLPPAIFACVLNDEADAILSRIRLNRCRPSLSWFTTATWGWANGNPDVVPFFQGGGQWHENFKYSDKFFDTGQDVLNQGMEEFGYLGNYDQVVSYTIPTLIAILIQSFFRIEDFPDPQNIFSNAYETIRRAMININAKTLFGPVSFNEFQRNDGRGAAGMQWIPKSSLSPLYELDASPLYDLDGSETEDRSDFVLSCISPLDQADAAVILPSPSGSMCSPGSFVNETLIETNPALLEDKCSECPTNSYTTVENDNTLCIPCPYGSGTAGETGATECLKEEANLNEKGLKIMGFLFVLISWGLALGYAIWMIVHRNGTVVKISQPEFLLFICIGAIVSTSSIIPLTLAEADVGDDATSASKFCQAIPFLYSLGWVLMYSSLTAKSYRLTKLCAAASRMERRQVTAKQMYRIIIAFVTLDLLVLIAWQTIDPLTYVRVHVSKDFDDESGVVTVATVAHCSSGSFWKFMGPIISIHVSLMIITNVLLWKVRGMSDRYQEQKYVGLASIYICELLLLGLPILFAVQESTAARYIVIAGVIFLTDTGVLSLIFIPKIKFQSQGLPLGMSVVQSMNMRSSIALVPTRSQSRRSAIQNTTLESIPFEARSSSEFTGHVRVRSDQDNSGKSVTFDSDVDPERNGS